MEKIQSAIAKARAARAAAQSSAAVPSAAGAETAAPAVTPPAATPTPPTSEEHRPDPAAVAARWTALPGFAPAPGLLARNHIVAASAGKDAVPFDLMRTRLLQQMRANQWRRVAITSPGPACGKSTIALNLAMSLARQPDLRTVLAEWTCAAPRCPGCWACAPRKALPVCWRPGPVLGPAVRMVRTWRSAPVTPPPPSG